MKGSDLIVDFLIANGFSTIFGVPGRRVLPIYDAIYKRQSDLSIVVTQNEQGASFMADAFARLNGLGCCIGISGPGLINMLTGVAAAYIDSVPILVIGGQAQTSFMGKYGIQEATGLGRTPNQLEMFQSVTKYSQRVGNAKQLLPALEAAYLSMRTGRQGPVFLEIPTEVLTQNTDVTKLECMNIPSIDDPLGHGISNTEIDSFIAALKSKIRPLVLIGEGVNKSGASEEISSFIHSLGVPYVTTTLAKGCLPESSSQSLGSAGIWGQPAAADYILNESDGIMAFGTTFQELSSYGWRIKEDQILLRVDIDKEELNRNYSAKYSFNSDIKRFLYKLNKRILSENVLFDFSGAIDIVKSLKVKHGFYGSSFKGDIVSIANRINPIELIMEINKSTPDDVVMIADVGESGSWSMNMIQRERPSTYIINGGLGTMGHSVAGAIGLSLALPKKKIISICGDGGFMMNGNELATASKYKSNVIWIIFNNDILGTQKHYQRDYLDGRYIGAEMPSIDYCAFSESLGVSSHYVDNIDNFRLVYNDSLNLKGNHLIVANIDSDIKPEPSFFY